VAEKAGVRKKAKKRSSGGKKEKGVQSCKYLY